MNELLILMLNCFVLIIPSLAIFLALRRLVDWVEGWLAQRQ